MAKPKEPSRESIHSHACPARPTEPGQKEDMLFGVTGSVLTSARVPAAAAGIGLDHSVWLSLPAR